MTWIQHRAASIGCILLLLLVTVLAVWSVLPPSPKGADAPSDDFSAERAFPTVQAVGQEVHPHGTKAAARVRDRIESELTELELEPEVVDGVGRYADDDGHSRVADTKNVVATIPGADSSGPLFMIAHYDSAEVSFGANDDGAGVATVLETARAVLAGPQQRNDIVLVFTDAEESCLCGAEAFVHSNPLAADGGVVLNFEARGSSGPATMFETSDGNADLIDAYAQVPYPVGSSLAVEVYRALPNDTDFSPFLDDPAKRFTGLNTAYIDGSAVYHSPRDTPDRMSRASLQHHGSNALALVRELGDADITALAEPSTTDATYFTLPGGLLARYPGWLVWPLALASVAAVVALAVVGARRREVYGQPTTLRRLVLGFFSAVLPVAFAALGAMGLWWLMVKVRSGYGEMLDPWQPWAFRLAMLGIVATVLTGWFLVFRRWLGAAALSVGCLGWLAVLGVVLAAFAPGGSYLTALPALAGSVAGLVSGSIRGDRNRADAARRLVPALGASVGLLVLVPVVILFLPALGLATGAAPAVAASLLGLVLVPVMAALVPRGRLASSLLVGACATVTLLALITGFATGGFDPEHPEPTRLAYVVDADTGDARWVSDEVTPSDWTSRYVDERLDLSADFPMLDEQIWAGEADDADLNPAEVEVTRDSVSGRTRTITFTVRPGEGRIGTADSLRYIGLSADGITSAFVAGREIPTDDGTLDTRYMAPDEGGFEVVLAVPAGGDDIDLRLVTVGGGLDDLPGFVVRPDDVGVMGSHTAEQVLVGTTVTL